MKYPAFFDDVENITVQDDLAKFLGVNEDGIMEISYLDVVKSSGHSCATVAGAYLIALEGLKALYENEIPQRGKIKVELKRKPTEDNAGVVACVLSNITGATSDFGFGGLPTGQFNRRDRLFFDVDMDFDVRMTRLDNMKSVGLNYEPHRVANPEKLVKSVISPTTTEEEKQKFPHEFQEMVRKILESGEKVVDVVHLN